MFCFLGCLGLIYAIGRLQISGAHPFIPTGFKLKGKRIEWNTKTFTFLEYTTAFRANFLEKYFSNKYLSRTYKNNAYLIFNLLSVPVVKTDKSSLFIQNLNSKNVWRRVEYFCVNKSSYQIPLWDFLYTGVEWIVLLIKIVRRSLLTPNDVHVINDFKRNPHH